MKKYSPPTHAILFSDWCHDHYQGDQNRYHETLGYASAALLPLLDKPMLQIAIEHLVRLGVTHIDLMVDEAPAEIRQLVSNGERWGVTIVIHYYDPELALASNLTRLALQPDQSYWIASAELMPQNHQTMQPACTTAHTESAGTWIHDASTEQRWVGWGLVRGHTLQSLTTGKTTCSAISALQSDAACSVHVVSATNYSVETPSRYRQSQQICLIQRATESPAGVVIARSARLHPGAIVNAPVYIGARSMIGPMAKIGPNAIIGEDCVISDHTEVTDSVVMPNTAVSSHLTICKSIASQRTLLIANARTAGVQIDDALIGTTAPGQLRAGIAQRLTAAALWITLSPFAWLTAKPSLAKAYPWLADLHQSLYPGIALVASGKYRLFGPSITALVTLPAYTRPGLLNERLLAPATEHRVDGRAYDAMAVAGLSTRRRAQILSAYSLGLMRDCTALSFQRIRQCCIRSPRNTAYPKETV